MEEINVNNLTFLRVKAHSSERGKARDFVYNKWEVAWVASRTVVSSAYLSLHSQVVVGRLTKMAKSRGLILDPGEFLHEGIQVMIMIFLPLLFKISQTRRHLSI